MSNLSHGLVLLDHNRYEEAEACFLELLAQTPEDSFIYSRLALSRMNQQGRKKHALEAIDEAIQYDPNEDYYHALRSLILSDLHRYDEALETADRAIAIEPESPFNYSAKASAYCDMSRWANAEDYARKALAIYPEDTFANHLLTNALRLQGKSDESQYNIQQQLADAPESSLAHTNAGWDALQKGDNRKAEEHFKEALRLDASMEGAREGLIESFKARSWFYRLYLNYCFFMQRFTSKGQWAIIIGAYLAYTVIKALVDGPAYYIVIVLWLSLVMWVWLAPGIGSFLVAIDRTARYALTKMDLIHGWWTGISLIVGVPLLVFGILTKGNEAVLFAGGTLLASTIPAAMTFTNQSSKGRITFGSITGLVLLLGCLSIVLTLLNLPPASLCFVTAIIIAALTTWLGNIPALRRDDSG